MLQVMREWFVVRTQRNREAWAAENILRQFAEPYAPKYAERVRVGPGQFELRPRLLFPRYLFVRTVDGHWRFLLSTYGVSSVLLNGNQPAVMPHSEIQKLKQIEDAEGLVVLPKVMVSERFKRGASVRVTEGVYSGYTGIYDGCGPKDRERILLDYLGRKTLVLIDTTHLAVA